MMTIYFHETRINPLCGIITVIIIKVVLKIAHGELTITGPGTLRKSRDKNMLQRKTLQQLKTSER